MGRKQLSGFTLIELLVVIAIIAILAAILFPVFASAKRRANTGVCQSHQKQLVASLMAYTDDYAGRLPRFQFLSTGGGGGLLCMPYVRNVQILLCPAMFTDPDNFPSGFPKVRNMGFSYNQQSLCDTQLTRAAVASTDVYETKRTFDQWTGRPLGSIVRTSRTPAFFCAESVHSFQFGNRIVYVGFGWEAVDSRNPGRMVNAHAGGSNYSFLDGHARYLRPAGNGFYVATDGLDYDGNGTFGDRNILR